MEQAEAVFNLAKVFNDEDGGFTAEGLEDSKVGRTRVGFQSVWLVPVVTAAVGEARTRTIST